MNGNLASQSAPESAAPATGRPIYDALHIGEHKCASTYLQRVGLKTHPEVELVWRDHVHPFHALCDYHFGFDRAAFLEELQGTAVSEPNSGARVRVFSYEGLCGDMFAGRGARTIAEQCVAAFGPIKAFVVVREPYSMVYSTWNQYVQEGGVLDLSGFLSERASPAQPRFDRMDNIWRKLRYIDLVRYWSKLVGPERFRVLLLEDLAADADRFFAELYGFLGVDAAFRPALSSQRSAYPYAVTEMKRVANRLVRSDHNPTGLLPQAAHSPLRLRFNQLAKRWRPRPAPDVAALVPAPVRADLARANRALAEHLDRDLAALGYDLGG